jgi:hypothetical protein
MQGRGDGARKTSNSTPPKPKQPKKVIMQVIQ